MPKYGDKTAKILDNYMKNYKLCQAKREQVWLRL